MTTLGWVFVAFCWSIPLILWVIKRHRDKKQRRMDIIIP